jgi:hypothetical protein
MAYTEDIQARIRQEAQEANANTGYKSPVGTFHVRIAEETQTNRDQEGIPRLRIDTEIVCGPNAGTHINIFQGYFAKATSAADPNGERYSKRQQSMVSMFKGFWNGLVASRNELEGEAYDIWDSVKRLPAQFEVLDPTTVEQVAEVMDQIVATSPGLDGFLQVKDAVKSDNQYYNFIALKNEGTVCDCDVIEGSS